MGVVVERYPAVVTTNDDDEQRGRIKVSCMELLGDEDTELPMWVEPVLDWGWFYVPDIGEQVEVDVVVDTDTDEVPGQGSLEDLDIRWRGKRFYSEEGGTPIHEEFVINYGKRRGFATPAGHIVVIDDTEGSEQIRVSLKLGDNHSYLVIGSDGNVVIGRDDGKEIHIKAETISLGSESPADKVALASLVKGQLDGVKADLDAIGIFGGATGHTHMTPMGPSGPPLPPLVLTYAPVEPKSDVVESE